MLCMLVEVSVVWERYSNYVERMQSSVCKYIVRSSNYVCCVTLM